MTRLACLAVLACSLGGCPAADDASEFPVAPGGGGPSGSHGSSTPDAGTTPDGDGGGDAGDGGAMVTGQVCIVEDLRALSTCATTGADGLTVEVEGHTATTTATGMFTIVAPVGSTPTWHVTGTTIVPTALRISTANPLLPAVLVTRYEELVTLAQVAALAQGAGVLVATVQHGTDRVAGVTATVDQQIGETVYDGPTADSFARDSTHDFGLVWIASALVGARTVTLELMGDPTSTAVLPIEDRTITFATIALP